MAINFMAVKFERKITISRNVPYQHPIVSFCVSPWTRVFQ